MLSASRLNVKIGKFCNRCGYVCSRGQFFSKNEGRIFLCNSCINELGTSEEIFSLIPGKRIDLSKNKVMSRKR